MNLNLLAWNPSLARASRLRPFAQDAEHAITRTETLVLLSCGALSAAAVLLVEFKLKVPGHAILRAVFPMSLGLALMPRRGAGTLMGLGAIATATVLLAGGHGKEGLGALTSLCLIGPCLDWAVRGSRSGRRVYLSLVLAGVAANLGAMSIQAAAKGFGWDVSTKSLAMWLPMAAMTYPITGAIAGLLGAVAWFKWSETENG